MKTTKSIFADIIESIMTLDDIKRGITGNQSNLFCEVRNSSDSRIINNDVAEFIHYGITEEQLDVDEVTDILENPDWIIYRASERFREALAESMQATPNTESWDVSLERASEVIEHAKSWFDRSGGDYFVFAEPWSNACVRYYIIRADSEHEALEEVITRFERDFEETPENQAAFSATGDGLINSNGTFVNIDNLQLLASFRIHK